jgi:hypothetical protein
VERQKFSWETEAGRSRENPLDTAGSGRIPSARMNREPITLLLATALLLSVTLTAGLCYWYLQCTRQLNLAQMEVARANNNRAAMQSLATESIEYAKRNPDMIAVLQSLGLRSRIETNQPAQSR